MNYESYLTISTGDILLSLVVTVVSYMLVPVLFRIINKEPYDKKSSFKIALINSIIVGFIFMFIKYKTIDNYNKGLSMGPMTLYYFINNWLLKKEFKKINRKNQAIIKKEKVIIKENSLKANNKKQFSKKLFYYLVIVLLLFSNIFFVILYADTKNEVENNSVVLEEIDKLLKDKTIYELQDKLNFYDDNIVIAVEGYGDNAYHYDCLKKYVEEEEFAFLAYNKSFALDEGYKIIECK